MIKIKKGLDLPIKGEPEQTVKESKSVTQVAVLGDDYVGMKPTMAVEEGDSVKLGQELFADKKNEGIIYTAPAAGRVVAINRGSKRKLLSVVVEIEGDDAVEFDSYSDEQIKELNRDTIVEQLVKSGLWTALRTRPYSKVPAKDSTPDAIFVTAIDTHPLSADPAIAICENQAAFDQGLRLLSKLTQGKVFVCTAPSPRFEIQSNEQITHEEFAGCHPAGLPGTHIHFLHGASNQHPVWHIGYQDVIAFGKLFSEGKIYTDRIIAIGGPSATNPRLVKTRIGASFTQLLDGEVVTGDNRHISGSVFSGFSATGARAYLGRYHNQVSLLPEGREKEFFGWLHAGTKKHSVTRAFVSHLTGNKKLEITTTTGGSERSIMPIGSYERIMPLDILATQLLRALVSKDTDTAQQLGCLELDEEDLALATYVCPGKFEYGPILRDALVTIEKEG